MSVLDARSGGNGAGVAWRDWPAARMPARAAMAAGVALAAGTAVAAVDPWLGALGLLLLLGAVAEVLLPTAYRVDGSGVHLARPGWRRAWPWRAFRAWRRTPEGALLLGAGPHRWIRRRRTRLLRRPPWSALEPLLRDHLGAP